MLGVTKTTTGFGNLLKGPTGLRSHYVNIYGLLELKDTEQSQQNEKAHREENRENQATRVLHLCTAYCNMKLLYFIYYTYYIL